MVNTPVLFETFARPDYARQAFDAIKRAKPRILYFYSNKARLDRPDEVRRNEEIRAYVKEIDWECDLHTFFRDEYVDVFTSLWGSLDWFFNNVKEGIVIEEDVVTCPAFYNYMSTLLEKYRDNNKVWIISGNNALPQYTPSGMSYFFSRFADIYGWASWSDRWHALDREMTEWPSFSKSKAYHDYYSSFIQRRLQKIYYNQVYNNKDKFHSWDIVFNYSMALNMAYCITPYTNLSADIGVSGANHSSGMESPLSKILIKTDSFPFEIGEPSGVETTSYDDEFYFHNRFMGLIKRKLNKYFHIRF